MNKSLMEPPVIKWSGSKRRVADRLASVVPKHQSYFEPFLGGGAMLPKVRPCAGVVSDIIPELIELWRMIQLRPADLAAGYRYHWEDLQQGGHQYYYRVRDEFNSTRDPVAFLFLSRTCVNGLIRFNKDGDFNNSLHHTRPGIHPDRLENIIHRWSQYIAPLEVISCDYREALKVASSGDFAFLDPPYVGNRGRYLPGGIDYSEFINELDDLTSRGVRWMVTLDGSAGDRDYAAQIPPFDFAHSFRLGTGHSPFTRLMGSSLDSVSESVFINYDPVLQGGSLFDHLTDDPSCLALVND
jgi:DNA adenine methylase